MSFVVNVFELYIICILWRNHLYNDTKSEYFMCNIGVGQGENLSPLLFTIFLNDIEHYFKIKMLVA